MSEIRAKKHLNYLFLNTGSIDNPLWARATKSTDFSISYGASTETFDFISDEVPSNEVASYKPTLGQTQYAYIGNKIYDYIIEKARNLDKGESATTQVMIVYQESLNGANRADLYDCTLIWDTNDIVAGTITYTINFKGNPQHGTATINEEGQPVFNAI